MPESVVLYEERGSVAFISWISQHIAAAPNGFDVVHPTRCRLKFFAQLTDEYIDDFEFRLVHSAVQMVEEHLFRQG